MQASLPPCKYGASCYRKNPAHLAQYYHPLPSTTSIKRGNSDGDAEQPNAKRPCVDTSPVSRKPVSSSTDSNDAVLDSETSTGSTVAASVSSGDSAAAASPVRCPKTSASSDADADTSSANVDLTSCPAYVTGDKATRVAVAAWLQAMYGVPFPDDFFHLWDFCYERSAASPKDALKSLLGVSLAGPYDFLAGLFADPSILSVKSVHLHCRCYFDPPEFLTLLAEVGTDGQHWGYFRDHPDGEPDFVAVSSCQAESHLLPAANTALATLVWISDRLLAREKDKATAKALRKLQEEVQEYATRHGCAIAVKSVDRVRSRKVVARPLNRIGIVVPYDKKQDIGYRPLPLTNSKLKALLDRIVDSKTPEERDRNGDELQDIVTCVQFANDECDYGMGLELAMDLFAHGSPLFHSMLGHLLPTAYELLGRDIYAKIIKIHLANRTKSIQV